MFEAARMLFIYVETPLHAGAGRALGPVDLPIQRERTTGYPMVQASSIKGRLRAEARKKCPASLSEAELLAIFGPETEYAADHAGALSAGDARLLLFPVRSLAGVFAWTTSVGLLSRFVRDAAMVDLNPGWNIPPEPGAEEAWVNGTTLVAGDSVVLEDFSFTPRQDHAQTLEQIGRWLADEALPKGEEYGYWRRTLPKKLCVLPENAFRDFVLYATEVQTHIRLNPDTKTVVSGGLWTSESLPTDTLLYAPLMATRSRSKGVNLSGAQILEKMCALNLNRTRLGGDETTGQGVVALRITGGGGK
ncbi:MAG: type III-B CRISPR module RAMP protein Cmr4 [Desulfotomaculales bacterium]